MSTFRRSAIASLIVFFGFTGVVSSAKFYSFLPAVVAQTPTNTNPKPKQNWLKELNLTTNQLARIQAIRKNSKAALAQKRQAVQKAKQDLETAMANTTPQNEVRKKYHLLKTLRQQLNDAQFENTLAIREVLTPEQRQKYADHMYKNRH